MALKNVLVFGCVIAMISASAIPMWEYLSKDEKMSYLYNMFHNQVDEYCNSSNMGDCKNELIEHGLKNLHGMPENDLDNMDPYQRDAHTIIWESMMKGHEMMKKTSKKEGSTAAAAEKDAYEYFSESNYLGSASARQETVLNLNGKLVGAPTKAPGKHFGPMIVKVHLDGRPVQEEKSIPADDDVHHYHILKTKVPALSSLEARNEKKVPVFKGNSPYPYAAYTRPSRR